MNYLESLSEYKERLGTKLTSNLSDLRAEHHFECLRDWNVFHNILDVKKWYELQRKSCTMEVQKIPVKDCKDWVIDESKGDISHVSGEFFSIHGLRINSDNREVGRGGWDQPILTQVGNDGGILGLVRKRFEGIPHYLVEAKAEPGNYGMLQLSPTLQATFSNLKRAHKGKRPLFADIFEEPDSIGAEVLYDQWLSEDGGRLFLKRNRGMLVEVPHSVIEEIPNGFIWLSMWQIKELLHEDAWVNPHIRGIISNL